MHCLMLPHFISEPGESLANVLEDLKFLTDAVLKDNDSDMESD